ncbi:MAG TPA: hypothetical protein VK772_16305 [Puia sp.]|nr:hypothetical protein [Puia sp.]
MFAGEAVAQIPVSSIKITSAPTSFDKKDSLVVVVPGGTELNFVSYLKLDRNKSFVEFETSQYHRDDKLRAKYPYNYDDFYGSHQLLPSATKQSPRTNFFDIPDENILRINDTTYKVYFAFHEGFIRKDAEIQVTYFKANGKKGHFRKSYMEKDADFLEPASRYMIIIGTSGPDDRQLFDLYDGEYRIHPNNTPKTDSLYRILDSATENVLWGRLHFFPSLQEFKDIYATDLKIKYDKLNSTKKQQNTDISMMAKRMFNVFRNNAVLPALQQSLTLQQTVNQNKTGLSRDSLTDLFNTISNLATGSDDFYKNVCSGNQSLNVVFTTGSSDANAEMIASVNSLNRLIEYADSYALNLPVGAALKTSIKTFHDSAEAWTVTLTNNIKANKEIKSDDQKITKSINESDKLSHVTLTAASSFTQDILIRGKLSIAPDFGVVAYGFLQGKNNANFTSVTPYLGAQINFRPFDQSVPFGSLPKSRRGLLNPIRFSGMIGITFVSVSEPGKRENFFSGTNLLLGLGYRLCTEVRVVGGAMLFRKYNSDFASSQTSTAATFYAGVSIDLNLKDLFNNVFGVFTGK